MRLGEPSRLRLRQVPVGHELAHLLNVHGIHTAQAISHGLIRLYGMYADLGRHGYAVIPDQRGADQPLPVTPPPTGAPKTGRYAAELVDLELLGDDIILAELLVGDLGTHLHAVIRHAIVVQRAILDALASGRTPTRGTP